MSTQHTVIRDAPLWYSSRQHAKTRLNPLNIRIQANTGEGNKVNNTAQKRAKKRQA